MKKKMLLIPLALLLAMSLVAIGCPAPAPPPPAPPVPAPPVPVPPVPAPPPVPAAPPEVFKWTVQVEQPAITGASIGVKDLFDKIRITSGGRIDASVHYIGEIVPGYEEYRAVKEGVLDAAFIGTHQFIGVYGMKANLFGGSGFPGGPTPMQNLAWFYTGDGLKLANELYGDWCLVVGFQGNTPELFCHSNVKLETAADFEGVKFRTAGAWGEILSEYYGASVVLLPGGEIYSAAERGIIDAFEYCSAVTNWPMGFHEITKYIGVPGIHSPGGGGLIIVNTAAWNALPSDLKLLVEDEVRVSGYDVYQNFIYQDAVALEKYREYGTEFFTVSDEMQRDIVASSKEYHKKYCDEDPVFKKIWDNLTDFISVYKLQAEVDPGYTVFD